MINYAKHVFYQLYERLVKKSNIKKAEAEIIHFEALDVHSKEKVRAEKLINLLKRVHEEVPYYQKLFDQNHLEFTNLDSVADFLKIPILTKKIIRENFEAIKNIQIEKFKWFKSSTSGSTGDPLVFILDQEFDDIKKGLRNYQIRINNKKVDDTVIKLWGFYHGNEKFIGALKHGVSNWLQNRLDLNSIYLTESIMASFVKKIKSKKSVYIEAYAQSAFQLAKYINKNSLDINNVSAITTSASTLFKFMRDEIEKAFNCHVYNRYGSIEASCLAFERNHNEGLRVSISQYIVEVLNENGQQCKPGEEGDIVITNFSNFAFPFIRYRMGDRAVVKELDDYPVLSCLSLENVTGRVTDVFQKMDGSIVSTHYIGHLIGEWVDFGWIDKIKVIQQDYLNIQVDIVRIDRGPEPENEIQLMRKAIQKLMGDDCQVDINFVDQIEASPSGKYQYIKSLINNKENTIQISQS